MSPAVEKKVKKIKTAKVRPTISQVHIGQGVSTQPTMQVQPQPQPMTAQYPTIPPAQAQQPAIKQPMVPTTAPQIPTTQPIQQRQPYQVPGQQPTIASTPAVPGPTVAPSVPPTAPQAVVYPTTTPAVRPPTTKMKKIQPKPALKKKPPAKGKVRYSQYRYRTRILKGSILPILYFIFSFQMLSKYVYQYPDYYEYNTLMILIGFLLGLGAMAGMTIANLSRAKNNPVNGTTLKLTFGIAAFIPFLIILIILAFFLGIATAWQFSMGFFVAAIFPPLIVILYELTSKKKFFIQEALNEPSESKKLIAVAS